MKCFSDGEDNLGEDAYLPMLTFNDLLQNHRSQLTNGLPNNSYVQYCLGHVVVSYMGYNRRLSHRGFRFIMAILVVLMICHSIILLVNNYNNFSSEKI